MCPAARSIALDQHLADRLVPGLSIWEGLHCSFPSTPWVSWLFSGRCFAVLEEMFWRRDANLENSSTCPCCCDHTEVYAIPWSLQIILLFQAVKRKKAFVKKVRPGRGGLETASDPWDAGIWLATACNQAPKCCTAPGCPVPRSALMCSKGWCLRACFGHLAKQALLVGRARKFSLTQE